LSDLGFKENMACRVTGVSRSCYYEFKYHVPSDRQIRRLLLSALVADIHKRSRGTYGMLRIRAALMREQNMVVNKKLILSIMRELGIQGLPGPKRRKKNLVNAATEEDLVQRNFTVDRPNVLWLTDITEHPTREGKVYCCCVLDAYSRRIVGWAIDRRCETALVNDAVLMASESRPIGPGSIIHSDHGSQGGINWSSQHLDHGGVQCETRTDRRKFAYIGGISLHRDDPESRGERTGSSSGRPSLAA
jgi:putative transposase